MLSEEEKQAIEYLNDFKSIKIMYGNTFVMFLEQLKKYQQAANAALNLIAKLQKENEELKSDNLEKARILEIFDYRKYRKKYLEERRKEEPNLLYPDGDEIYKRYYEQKKQIDLMAEYINNIQDCPLENCGVDLDCENRCDNNEKLIEECWKIYFESKVHKNE